MSIPLNPPAKNRSRVYTSSPVSPVKFPSPMSWFYPVGAGNVVLRDEEGTAVTYTSLTGYEGGIVGPFTELTSFTCTRVIMGDGPPPAPPTAAGAASGTTIADAGGFTAQTTVEGALQELLQDANTSLGIIRLGPADFVLATGAPLAVFADGASAVPGLSLTDSEVLCVRWNNNGTLDAILGSFHMPPDCDIASNMVAHFRASKTGATLADAVTFLVAAYNQVNGALHDADANYGGTSSAMTGDAAAKTVQDVTLTLLAANLAAHPASATITVKPTDGTLGTDDLCLEEVYILYKRKPLTS